MHRCAICCGTSEGRLRRSSSAWRAVNEVSLSNYSVSQVRRKSQSEHKHKTANWFHTEIMVLIKCTVGANLFQMCFCAHEGSFMPICTKWELRSDQKDESHISVFGHMCSLEELNLISLKSLSELCLRCGNDKFLKYFGWFFFPHFKQQGLNPVT